MEENNQTTNPVNPRTDLTNEMVREVKATSIVFASYSNRFQGNCVNE